MNYEKLRVGNTVEYIGPIQRFKPNGTIIEIETLNDRETYRLSVENLQNEEREEIRAYEDDIKLIEVNANYLKENGFSFSDQDKLFRKDGVTIASVRLLVPANDIYGQPGTMIDDRGFGIVTGKLYQGMTQEELLESVIILNFEHALQNYYNDKLGREF